MNQKIMAKFNVEEVFKKYEEKQAQRIILFGKDFLQNLSGYLYAGIKIMKKQKCKSNVSQIQLMQYIISTD
jgi:hypothetical protein